MNVLDSRLFPHFDIKRSNFFLISQVFCILYFSYPLKIFKFMLHSFILGKK